MKTRMHFFPLMLMAVLSLHTLSNGQTNVFPQDGNAGIGTTTPQVGLHIIRPPAEQLRLQASEALNYWNIYHNASAKRDYGLRFVTNGNAYLVLNNSTGSGGSSYFPVGKVGIGTAHPQNRLDVAGVTRTEQLYVMGTETTAGTIRLGGEDGEDFVLSAETFWLLLSEINVLQSKVGSLQGQLSFLHSQVSNCCN